MYTFNIYEARQGLPNTRKLELYKMTRFMYPVQYIKTIIFYKAQENNFSPYGKGAVD